MNLLMWLVLVILVVLALKKKARSTLDQAQTRQNPPPEQPDSRPAAKAETMVCCAHCQMYLPASEAVYGGERGEQVYCSQAHADHA
ncbi:PP0621 family protein [Undibacterium sp. Di26W]|uniref:PP0621 family protein n=1 Tax=Undibacterium sp. Di26W TaxID=3413035 RepID=UPI003BF1C837